MYDVNNHGYDKCVGILRYVISVLETVHLYVAVKLLPELLYDYVLSVEMAFNC